MTHPLPPSPSPAWIRAFRRNLARWFRCHARVLPWRGSRDPYAIWVSEILLQQTRVETVIPYYARFLAAFPTVESLASAPPEAVLKLWEGLGYYRRARLLHRGAQYIVRVLGGRFPATAEAWRTIPGVGRYTAGAIASIASDEPAPLVDGNVKRVLARAVALRQDVDGRGEAAIWDLAACLVPSRRPGDFNQAMMELGATVCLPRSPHCAECPIRRLCAAHGEGAPEKFPVRRAKRPLPRKRVVAAAIERGGRLLLCRRVETGMLAGMWELPGGTVREGESDAVALRRILREDVGVGVEIGPRLAVVEHVYSHFAMTLAVYRCVLVGPAAGGRHRFSLSPDAYDSAMWMLPEEIARHPIHSADRKAMRKFLQETSPPAASPERAFPGDDLSRGV